MTRKYWVVFEWAGKNFSGYAPDISGCMATAKTRDGVRNRLKGALEAHLQWLQSDGGTIPDASPCTRIDMIDDPEYPNPRGYYVVVERLDIKLPMRKTVATKSKSETRQLAAA